MKAALVCKEYGWTWEEYQDAPAFFLDVISIKMSTEAKFQQKQEFRQQQSLSGDH